MSARSGTVPADEAEKALCGELTSIKLAAWEIADLI